MFIKFRNMNKTCMIRYFVFNLCEFCIQSSFGSLTSNIQYFTFNLCIPCIYGSFCSYNHFHNILRLFNVLPNLPFKASETKPDYQQ